MSKLTVYPGSPVIIEKPQFGGGNPNNDYGLGFYCTETLDLAKEWACSAETDGYANKYTLDMSDLAVLSLTGGDYNILNWLAILLENRKFRIGGDVARQARDYIFKNFGIDYKSYDVIKGYRADDSYFSFASAFLNNTISLSQLERAMVLGKLGEQVVAVPCYGLAHLRQFLAGCQAFFCKRYDRSGRENRTFGIVSLESALSIG